MARRTWVECLYSATDNATEIANDAAEALMIPDLPLNYGFWYPGKAVRATLKGILGISALNPSITFRARFNGLAGTVLTSSGNLPITGLLTSVDIYLEFWFVARQVTPIALNVFSSGRVFWGGTAGDTVTPFTTSSQVNALDISGATSSLSFTADFTAASVDNTLTIQQAFIEALN